MDEWGKKKNGQAYVKKQKTHSGQTNEHADNNINRKNKHLQAQSKLETFNVDLFIEAFDTVFLRKIRGEKEEVKMIYSPSKDELFVGTNKELENINDAELVSGLTKDYDFLEEITGVYEFKKIDNDNVILDSSDFIDYEVEERSKPATKNQMNKYNMNGKNIVIISNEEFFTLVSNAEYDAYSDMEKYQGVENDLNNILHKHNKTDLGGFTPEEYN